MFNSDDWLSVFKLFFYAVGIFAFIFIIGFCIVSIDTSNILEICFCPQCGFDLRG